MKKFFLDFEFIEGFRRAIWWLPSLWFFNKKYWTIEMISIGIYCDDKREYYAINKNFNKRWASDWVKQNVIAKLPPRKAGEIKIVQPEFNMEGGASMAWAYQDDNPLYKSIEQIKLDILDFIGAVKVYKRQGDGGNMFFTKHYKATTPLEFYGYYADYDWVLLCTLFGTMMDLPEGMPMYCKDLKQTFDEVVSKLVKVHYEAASLDGKSIIETQLKNMPEYPKQQNERCAIDDAKWNYELYKFLEVMKNSL